MKVRFHTRLYSKTAITDAKEAFEEAADIVTSREGNHIVVEIVPKGPEDADEVLGEFENYVLAGTIAKRGNP